MSDIYAFFLDIDGTLSRHSKIIPKNIEAIKYARERGHKVFINTARGLSIVPDDIFELEKDGLIAGIGCTIFLDGEKIVSEKIDIKKLAGLFDYFVDSGRDILFEGENVEICSSRIYEPGRIPIESGAEMIERFGDETITKGFIPYVLPEEERKMLSEEYLFIQQETYAELSKKGFSKAQAMLYLIDRLGIDVSHCVAMGDSKNDIDMLLNAGISVAMGDASDDVKEIATIVSCNAEDGGVAEAIYKILGR